MLGRALVAEFAATHTVFPSSRHRPRDATADWLVADIAVPGTLTDVVRKIEPDCIVHAAAMTNVDECERNPATALRVNRDSVDELADYCSATGASLIYISTDAVFDGQKASPYSEADPPNPINAYGRAKLGGEHLALRAANALVIRTNIFGWRRNDSASLAEWILDGLRTKSALTMFTDVLFSPIAVELLAPVIKHCAERRAFGTYNGGGSETISKYDFSIRLANAFGLPTTNVRPISVDEKHLVARRPKNMAMDCSKLEAFLGRPLPGVDESLAAWKSKEPTRKK
jgi:dTDP-4-dehydrorhamnose reductase